MNFLIATLNRSWDKMLVFLGVLGVLLPTSPLNMPLTDRDQGVFLYIGWRILNGELPYRDVWDHKPPVVFYVNALGLMLANNSRWGVWLIEFIGLFAAAFIGFILIKKALGTIPSVISLVLWLLTLTYVIWGGNLTTEYTLSLQFAVLWLFYDSIDRTGFSYRRWFLIGLLGAVAFFTKQTAIGIWIAVILNISYYRLKLGQTKLFIFELMFTSFGFLVICLFWVMFFGLQGALPQFWSAVFKYNFVYVSENTDLASRLVPLVIGIEPLTKIGLFQLAMIGYVLGIVLFQRNKKIIRNWEKLLAVCLIDLPIELLFVSTSGRQYPHYYMTLLPVLSVFAALTIWLLFQSFSALGISNKTKHILAATISGIFIWSSFAPYRNQINYFKTFGDETVNDYVRIHTSPDEYVLLWGGEADVNYFAQRRSPTRFVYQYPLYSRNYVDEQMINEYLDDIIKYRPRLIIDTYEPFTPIYSFPIRTEEIDAKIVYLRSRYRFVENIDSWTVYEYK